VKSEQQQHAGGARRRRRSGGRAGLRSLRTEASSQAVQPGLTGGAYKPLGERDIQRIHSTALKVLAEVGIADPIPEILAYALPGGCVLGDDNRLRFPASLVESLIDLCPSSYVLHAPDPEHDQEISGQRVFFSTSGEAVSMLDYAEQVFRPTRLTDLYDAARLADCLDHIHQFGQPFIASEFSSDLFVHDMNIGYAELAGTSKPFALAIADVAHLDPLITMFDTYLGEQGGFLKRPFCTFGGCPIVSPQRFAKDNAEVLVRQAELGLVNDVAVAPQAGATAPAALAGTLVQCFAETLACLVIVNLVRPGNPINFGMWPFVSDLRTGTFSGGGGEEALVMAATAQLCNHYGLISSIASGMTDSKTMDAQAGYEKAITTTAAALAGGNLVAAYPGVVGSLMGQSLEGMVIDNDMIGNVQRLVRGIEVTHETLSLETIKKAVSGSGHYLDHPQTLELMQTEYLYPALADRQSPGAWEDSGKNDIYQLAHRRVGEILSSHYPEYIDPKADARIRQHFPIRLGRKDMQAGNGRW
jgi:trimethylamine--corrinoid protein Co-methyltransferase